MSFFLDICTFIIYIKSFITLKAKGSFEMKTVSQVVLILASTFSLLSGQSLSGAEIQQLWEKGRTGFYAAVEEKDSLRIAFQQFELLRKLDPKHTSRALVYIGALTALKGKHSKLPWSKMKWVKRGLPIMDQAVEMAPREVEVRFIRGMTCFYLPSFFERKNQAIEDFNVIINALPDASIDTNLGVLKNALEFIRENVALSVEEKQKVDSLLQNLVSNE